MEKWYILSMINIKESFSIFWINWGILQRIMSILYELMLQCILGVVSMSINNLLGITINNIIRFLLSFVYIILISPSNHRSNQPTPIIWQISILFYVIVLISICILRVTSNRLLGTLVVILYFMRVIAGLVDISVGVFF